MRRDQRASLLLLVLGSAVVLLAGVRPWLTGVETLPTPLPAREVTLRASDLAPGVRAVGLLGLAGVLAVVAARARLRPVVGGLLAAAGLVVALLGARVLVDPGMSAAGAELDAEVRRAEGPVLAVVGGLLLTVAGLLTAVRGRRWDSLGRRYDAPTGPRPAGERDLWEALDRGEDPTGPQDPPSSGPAPRG